MKFNVYITITSSFSGERKVTEAPVKGNPVEAGNMKTLLIDLAQNLPTNKSLDLETIGIRVECVDPEKLPTIKETGPSRLEKLEQENARLLRGEFTEEEFQTLCHTFDESDACRFRAGCERYQQQLFGKGAMEEFRDKLIVGIRYITFTDSLKDAGERIVDFVEREYSRLANEAGETNG